MRHHAASECRGAGSTPVPRCGAPGYRLVETGPPQAETRDLRQNAAAKLAAKGIDLIVANDVSAPRVGFEHDTNAVVVLDAGLIGDPVDLPVNQ